MAIDTVAHAAPEAGEHVVTSGSYITHHLGHLRSSTQTSIIDFSVINYDTIFWSVLLALVTFFLLRAAPDGRNRDKHGLGRGRETSR